MVIRLFVPPGEGQHRLIPKRPDPLGANATLQYSLLSSTLVAAAYTSFASRYYGRVTPSQPVSTTALFIRSSARLGLWAGVVGAAVNCYYYSAFTNVVVLQKNPKVKPWRLYKWTKKFTIEDGVLAGAGLGLAASIPTLFMRRPAIPRWTRCLGLANIGACAGVLGAHAYLQYTGERPNAYKRLDRRLKRRSLEFWAIFWDKKLMALFDPLIQQYIRHNGLWYTHLLPESVYEQPDEYGRRPSKKSTTAEDQEEAAYYTEPFDYAEDLKQINIKITLDKMEELKAEMAEYNQDAEYLLFINAQKQHDYCRLKPMDEGERKRRLQEIHLIELAHSRLRSAAHAIEVKLSKWRISLQHKAIFCAPESESESDSASTKDTMSDWLPTSQTIDFNQHSPRHSLVEMEKFQTQIGSEVKRFEELITSSYYSQQKRDRWKKDLEDGRVLLQAVDHVIYELENIKKALESAKTTAKKQAEQQVKEDEPLVVAQTVSTTAAAAAAAGGEQENNSTRKQNMDVAQDEKKHDKTQVDEEKAAKRRNGNLDSDQD